MCPFDPHGCWGGGVIIAMSKEVPLVIDHYRFYELVVQT